MTIHVYNPHTHTHARTIKLGGLQLGELQSGFLLSRSVPLLCFHCPCLSTAPLGPGCQSRALMRRCQPFVWPSTNGFVNRSAQERGEGKAGGEGEWPPWHVSGLRSNLPPSSSSPPSFLLALSGRSFSSSAFILNSPRRPLSPERRPRQHRLAADYRCNHSRFR